MTVELEEFTPWRRSVEARLGRLEDVTGEHREKINEHAGLLGSQDEDLTQIQVEFRAQRAMLQALHLTQSEHSALMRDHTVRLTGLETGQAQLRSDMTEVRAGIRTIIDLLRPEDDGKRSGEPVN